MHAHIKRGGGIQCWAIIGSSEKHARIQKALSEGVQLSL